MNELNTTSAKDRRRVSFATPIESPIPEQDAEPAMQQMSPAPTERTRGQTTRQGDSDSDSDEYRLSDTEDNDPTTVPDLEAVNSSS